MAVQGLCRSMSALSQLTDLILDVGAYNTIPIELNLLIIRCLAMDDISFTELGNLLPKLTDLKALNINFNM